LDEVIIIVCNWNATLDGNGSRCRSWKMSRERRRGRRRSFAAAVRGISGVAWIAAAFSVLALILCLVNAASCHFLIVKVDGMPQHSIGLFCPNDENDDTLRIWSAFFFACSLIAATLSALLAAYHLFRVSSSSSISRRRLWQGQSIIAAFGAISTVPTFLLYQTDSCTSLDHSCQWDYGSVLMIVTCLCGVTVVLLTQCYPPDHEFNRISAVSFGKRRHISAATDLKVDRTMPNEDDEEDEEPTAILRIVGPVGHSEGVEVPMDHHHHLASTKQSQRTRLFPSLFPAPSLFNHAPMEDDSDADAIEEGRSVPTGPVLTKPSEDSPLDPIFSSTDVMVMSPYGHVSSNPTTDDSSASSPAPKDPTNAWKVPVIPNISLIDDVTEVENDDEEVYPEKQLHSFSGISAILDDLGSLEPTVLDGEESILDNDEDVIAPPPPPPPPVWSNAKSSVVPSSNPSKLSQWANVIPSTRKRQRAPRLIKGYHLLDDSDMESSAYYMSPPLEILTLNLSTEQDNDLHLADAASAAFGTSTYSSQEPEPYLEFSDDDDEDEETEYGDIEDSNQTTRNIRPERVAARDARRLRRKKRHDRSSDISMASSGSGSLNRSLLSVTIEEETAADLQEDASSSSDYRNPVPMIRSRSAPNLARFYSSSSSSRGRDEIYDDIHMTGIHQFHAAHIFREKPSSNRSEYEGSHGQRRRRRQLQEPDQVPMLQHTSLHKKNPHSLFRTERALRAGIHDDSLDNEIDDAEMLGDGDSSSIPSASRSLRYRTARIARLQRLKQQMQHHTNYVLLSNVPSPATKPEDSARNLIASRRIQQEFIRKSNVAEVKLVSSQMDPVSLRTTSSSSSSGLPKEEDDEPNEALNTSGYSSSVIDDSIGGDSYLIDLLDVQLAELNRPEGSMVGPDEASL
jgi:hypothetical protein